jgi:2-C-methyl-D-erythritol 4-phosphate cytidylyltransferase
MKKYAVIVAGGRGSRMGTPLPKQFLLLQGKPVLWHTLEVFLGAYEDLEIILVLPEGHQEAGRVVAGETSAPARIGVVRGGKTRFHSVQKGLREVESRLEGKAGRSGAVIFVHDGVRCLLTINLVHRCYEHAQQHGSAIPVIDTRDSVRLITTGGNEAIDRSRVKLVQTPQTFLSELLISSYQVEYRETFTDEATVVEASGHSVHLVEGENSNIKITMPVDLVVAEKILESRTGFF